MEIDRTGTVWAATWVPSASPIEGFGSEGYAVCWVDLAAGPRVQVLAAGDAPPPGTSGTVGTATFGDVRVDLFEWSVQ